MVILPINKEEINGKLGKLPNGKFEPTLKEGIWGETLIRKKEPSLIKNKKN